MKYFFYGATLAFAWFVSVNVLTSALVSLSARRVSRGAREAAPATRARILLWLRLLPATTAIAFILAIFVPSFVRFEPRNFDEAFGVTTSSLAVLACGAIVAAVWRGLSALADVRTRMRMALRQASPVSIGAVQAFRVDSPSVAMTLVGVLTPRLLVTGPLLDLLTPAELAAAVAHERGHLRSWDNLKRLAMRSAPDVFAWSRTSRRLEKEWCLAAEHAADALAARDTPAGLALASALVKVARFAPGDLATCISSPLVGGESLRSRVERLLDPPPERREGPADAFHAIACRALAWAAGASALSVAVRFGYRPLLFAVHEITEVVVHHLP